MLEAIEIATQAAVVENAFTLLFDTIRLKECTNIYKAKQAHLRRLTAYRSRHGDPEPTTAPETSK